MKKVRFTAILTALVMFVGTLSGCGQSAMSDPVGENMGGNSSDGTAIVTLNKVDETTDPTQEQDDTTETTVTSSPETSEDSSDGSAEASGTGNSTTKPTTTTAQTTEPATTTAQSGNSPAVTTTSKPSAASATTAAQTTKPAATTTTAHVHEYYISRTGSAKSVIGGKTTITNVTTYKCVCGDSYSEKVTTDGDGNVISDGGSTAPAVTTASAPAVTTEPAPGHTHSYSSKVTKEATCTATGTMTYTCSCGDKYTENIPAKGHNWKTETIHHDAEYGTRDVTETWAHVYYVMTLSLTPKGVEAGLGGNNLTDPLFIKLGLNKYTTNCHYVLLAELWGKPGDPSSVEWVYTYNNIDPKELEEAAKLIGRDDIKYDIGVLEGAVCNDYIDWLRNGLWYGNWGTTDLVPEYENRVVGTETYVIKDAYDETVTTCSVCGSKK